MAKPYIEVGSLVCSFCKKTCTSEFLFLVDQDSPHNGGICEHCVSRAVSLIAAGYRADGKGLRK